MYAQVLIEFEVKSLDHIFTYIIPSSLSKRIKKGMKVKVPFNNKDILGLVLNITNEYNEDYELKEIKELVNEEIYFSDELLNIGKLLSDSTLCNLVTAYKAMLPSSLKIKSNTKSLDKYYSLYSLNISLDEVKNFILNNKRGRKQNEILEELIKGESKLLNYNKSSINALIAKNLIKEDLIQEYRINDIKESIKVNYDLTEEQNKTYNYIKNVLNKYDTHLIYGVTASGKTEIYFRLIEDVLKNDKRVLVLVPEITLTSQMIKRFYDRFGNIVAVYHSGLSNGERNDEYLKIYRNESKIVVGTRSSVFAPIDNLGLIIVDEEHSDNFKQDTNPRYNAIDIAKYRAKYHNVPLILGSATPLLESMARAEKDIYKLHILKKRIANAILPKVSLVNMQDEIKSGNTILSKELFNLIADRLQKKEQIILLLNRRGFSPYITCQNCGYTYKCPNCDITMTYHKTTNNIRCHYCGHTEFYNGKCPMCKEESLSNLGLGTEKLEDYLKEKFKEASIIRMDTDTTTNKGMHEKILDEFKNHKYDILIGTQMISKGLDFPLVTLVGVLNADSSLNIPDFRSGEKTFSLLDQVAGRAGRGSIPGNVIIQTFNPDNNVLQCVVNHDYDSFYKYEMNIRKQLFYPPYCFITSIKIISKDYNEASKEATEVYNYLKQKLDSNTIILGPTTAALFKMNNSYRFQIVLKYKKDNTFKNCLKELNDLYKSKNKVYLEIDNNPFKI